MVLQVDDSRRRLRAQPVARGELRGRWLTAADVPPWVESMVIVGHLVVLGAVLLSVMLGGTRGALAGLVLACLAAWATAGPGGLLHRHTITLWVLTWAWALLSVALLFGTLVWGAWLLRAVAGLLLAGGVRLRVPMWAWRRLLDVPERLGSIRTVRPETGDEPVIGYRAGLRPGLTPVLSKLHTLVIGPSGNGKTALLGSVLGCWRGPAFVSSESADLIELAGPSRPGRVMFVDLGTGAPVPDGCERVTWSPLAEVHDVASAVWMAGLLVDASEIAHGEGGGQNAYFNSAAKQTLAALLYAAHLDGRPIGDVYDLVVEGADERSWSWVVDALRLASDPGMRNVIVGLLRQAADHGGRRIDSEVASIRVVLQVYALPSARLAAEEAPVNVRAFVRSSDQTLAVVVPLSQAKTAGPLAGVLADVVLSARAEAFPKAERETPRLLVVLDELLVAPVPTLPSHLLTARKNGVTVFAAVQTAESLSHHGGSGMESRYRTRVIVGDLADTKFLEDILLRQGEITVASGSRDAMGATSVQDQRIPAAAIADVARQLRSVDNDRLRSTGRVVRALVVIDRTPAAIVLLLSPDHPAHRPRPVSRTGRAS